MFSIVLVSLLTSGCHKKSGIDRFIYQKDGVIKDTKTGLQWAQDAGQMMTWDQANSYARNLRLGGYSDWRLPNKEELNSLVEYAKSQGFEKWINELFNRKGFKNVEARDYWSATPSADDKERAWLIDMEDGSEFSGYKNVDHHVWPVRGGQ
jgi:hypothetical protein